MRVELEDVHKHFGAVRANDGITLVVEQGTIHGLLGENGAGKTTLMKILSGYQPCDHGRVTVDGRDVCFASPAEAISAGIGMLHQDPLDVPPMSVLDNFVLGQGREMMVHRGSARREMERQCQRLGYCLDPNARVASLTVGERQQLEMARLLALGVRTIILDEPTTGISAPQKELLFQILHRLANEGMSVIFVSHKLDEVEALCSRASILRQGQVAGEAIAPFDQRDLVRMMFGQELSDYPRPSVPLGEPVLQMREVSIHSHRLQLERLSLEVRRGEVLGLAGLEGSGQRLVMQVCAGLLASHSGQLLVSGKEMRRAKYADYCRAGVAYIPAARLEDGMIGEMTLREHFALASDHSGALVDWDAAEERAAHAIAEFSIVGQPESRIAELSGGNQQRALLGLLPDQVSLLLLEHPTRGLDVESSRWVWSRLLNRRHDGTAIVFTSTDLDELVENSDRIVVFSGGRMSRPVSATDVTVEQLGYLIGGREL